LPYACWTW
jgi:hypothetical protein